ncbi:hypothetical protein BC941DRAFT_145864 [Chlamydoabsidia padenii]|nr:hypothetical protein BC941DRAFT_145864 [Chlamydoabsidia padenii]
MNEKKARTSTSSRPASTHSTNSNEPSSPQQQQKPSAVVTATSTTGLENNDKAEGQPVDNENETTASLEANDGDDNRTIQEDKALDHGKDKQITDSEHNKEGGSADSSSSPQQNDNHVLDASPLVDAAGNNNEPSLAEKSDTPQDDSIDIGGEELATITETAGGIESTKPSEPAHDLSLVETQEPANTNSVPKDDIDITLDSPTTTDLETTAIVPSEDNSPSTPKDDAVTSSSDTIQKTTSTTEASPDTSATLDQKSTAIPAASNGNNDRILAQREQQLLQAMETIAKLHDQIHGLQQDSDKATSQIKTLQNRLEEQQASQTSSRNGKKLELTIQDLNKQLVSKEEQIQGLLKEGEKLSKNELKQANTIKKLRLEKQDQDKTLADTRKRLDKANADLNDVTSKSKRSGETEKRARESVKMLTEMTERQTKHINKLETDLIQLKEQYQQSQAELTTTLESLDKERDKAKVESEQVYAAALEKEVRSSDIIVLTSMIINKHISFRWQPTDAYIKS